MAGDNISSIKNICKDFLPPVIWRAAKRLRGKKDSDPGIFWQGDYPDWQSAVAASTGYDQDAIFTRVRDAARAVRDGEALWERDSVLFHHAEYNWPLLASLMAVLAGKEGRKEGRKGSGCWISAEPLAAPIGSINPCWNR